jgi:hypothetical protein
MKKPKIVIAVILLICLMILALFLTFKLIISYQEANIQTVTDAKNYIIRVNNVIIKGGSKQEINNVLKIKIDNQNIMTGPDSYLRKKPNDKIIEKYQLENYVKQNDELTDNFDQTIKNNFEYKVVKTKDSSKNITLNLKYKSFYYFAYMADLNSLETEILAKTGYGEYGKKQATEEKAVNDYKAKVVAMQILNKHMSNYFNTSETKQIQLVFEKGPISKNATTLEYYLSNLRGELYKNDSLNQPNNRIKKYSKEVNSKNPLKLLKNS